MEVSQFTTIILKASDGHYLTQTADVELLDRTICTVVALGKNDTPENWKEITAEEGEVIKQEQEAARIAEEEARRAAEDANQ